MLYFEQRNNMSISCDVYTHRSENNIEQVLSTYVSENLKKATQFCAPSFFSKDSKPNSLYSFSLDDPLIAPFIASAALC